MPSETVDDKLARVNRRLEARRIETRARLATVPDLLDMAEALKATFGAKLVYLRIGDYESGDRSAYEARGCVWSAYQRPAPRKGALMRLRAREAATP